MPLQVNDIQTLNAYIDGVMERASHHAGNVSGIALALVGPILWRKDADPIEVMSKQGETKNVLWIKIGGQRYAFSYNHGDERIEMRRGTTHGNVVHTFTNATPLTEVIEVFRAL